MVWTSGGGGGHKTSSGGSTNKTVSVKSVELDKTTLELKEGESQQLVATITPSNATNKDVYGLPAMKPLQQWTKMVMLQQ